LLKKSTAVIIVVLFATLLLGGIGYALYKTFLMPNEKVVLAFEEGKLNVVVGGDVVDSKGQPEIVDERIMLPLDMLKKYIDPNASWDQKLHKLTVTTKDRVIRMKTDNLEAYVNNKPVTLNIPVEEKNGNVLVPIEFLSEFYNIEISYVKENNVITIDFKNRLKQTAEPIDSKAVVRTGRSMLYPIVKKLDSQNKTDNESRVFAEYDKWYKVRTSDGTVGYIEKRFVMVKLELVQNIPPENQAGISQPLVGKKLVIAWNYTSGADKSLSKKTGIEGLDVLSPTWFQVTGEDGSVKNSADAEYVKWAHKKGYKVWALFSNNLGDSSKSRAFLNSTDARDNSIRQVLAFAALYKLDGINLDFENLSDGDRDALTQYVREIAPLLREQGLIVSVDVNTLGCYDMKALGEIVDYVMLMAYDQHWKGGNEAGSVSELAWADKTVKNFLNVIPPKKLILGIPFYTRLWEESTNSDGSTKLDSKALSMAGARKFINDNTAKVEWDDLSGQFKSQFVKDGTTYKVWLENDDSINLRTSLVLKYELAGTAVWRLDFEEPEVWKDIMGNLKTILSYSEWKRVNANRINLY